MSRQCGSHSFERSTLERHSHARHCFVSVSAHAQQRMAARGVSKVDIDTVVDLGRMAYGRKGAIEYFVGKKEVVAGPRCLRDVEGLHVVVSLSGVVITVFKNRSPRKYVSMTPARRRTRALRRAGYPAWWPTFALRGACEG